MSHSADIGHVSDLIELAAGKLARGVSTVATLQELALRCFQRGARRYPPKLPRGVSGEQDAVTPIVNPRVAIDAPRREGRGRGRGW